MQKMKKKQRQNMRYETAGIIREVMGGNMDTVLVIYVELLISKICKIII